MRALLVPVKSFQLAKHRLATVLSDEARAQLARQLAAAVLTSADGLPVYVACNDGEVADWWIAAGAYVLWTPGLGLSGAVGAGVEHLASEGVDLVIVAHSDLALVRSLADFGCEGEVTIAPDRHLDGTNVVAVPAKLGFGFSYGPGSYRRHRDEAARLGLPCEVIHDWSLAADVDTPDDLAVVIKTLRSGSEADSGEQSELARYLLGLDPTQPAQPANR